MRVVIFQSVIILIDFIALTLFMVNAFLRGGLATKEVYTSRTKSKAYMFGRDWPHCQLYSHDNQSNHFCTRYMFAS